MKYIVKTLKFINDNFLYLFLFALILGIVFVFNFDATSLFEMMVRIWKSAEPDSAIDIYAVFSTMALIFNGKIIWFFLSAAFIVFGSTLIFSFCDRRMRIGICSFRKPFEKINENIMAVLVVAVVILLLYELYVFICSCLFSLVLLFDLTAVKIVLPILIVLFFMLFMLFMTIFTQWVPIMMIPGNSITESLAISSKSLQGKLFKVFLSLLFPFLVTYPIMLLAKYFLNFLAIDYIIFVICYMFQLIYICCNSMVIFFDSTGRERVDLKNPYELRR